MSSSSSTLVKKESAYYKFFNQRNYRKFFKKLQSLQGFLFLFNSFKSKAKAKAKAKKFFPLLIGKF